MPHFAYLDGWCCNHIEVVRQTFWSNFHNLKITDRSQTFIVMKKYIPDTEYWYLPNVIAVIFLWFSMKIATCKSQASGRKHQSFQSLGWTWKMLTLHVNIWKEPRLPWWLRWQRIHLQCGRPGFNPWVGKIPRRREWQPTPVFLPEKFHGHRSLVGYSPWGRKELDVTEWLNTHTSPLCVFLANDMHLNGGILMHVWSNSDNWTALKNMSPS